MKIPQDIIGDIAILKFPFDMSLKEKKKLGGKFLKEHKNIVTVLEKVGRFKGRLRKAKTKFIAGEKKKITIHNENGCKFFLDVDETYFSPRLSNERMLVSEGIVKKVNKNKNKILVMFAGVGPFPLVVARVLRDKGKTAEIISNEINRKASNFAEKNVKLNNLANYVRVVQGDSNKLYKKLRRGYKADFIVMPRPNLKDTFLKSALKFSRSGTTVYYYGFGSAKKNILDEIKKNCKKRITKIKVRKAGEIAPYNFRWLADFGII